MIITQIQITGEKTAQLKKMALSRNVSMAELIRQSIDLTVKSGNIVDVDERRQRAIAAARRFRSDIRALALSQDKYLAEAFDKVNLFIIVRFSKLEV